MYYWDFIFYIDLVLYILVLLTVVYLGIFAVFSLFNHHSELPKSRKERRFIILIPAYKNGKAALTTVYSILGQAYPQRQFDVTVVSDHLDEMSNFRLAQQPITLLTPRFQESRRVKSLQVAINNLPQFKIYDIVVILNPGNTVSPEFLSQLNDAFEAAGTRAIQTHIVSSNHDTAPARLSAVFSEVNNSIFRRGHIAVGLSAAPAGYGMAFDFNWFKQNIKNVKTTWDDKELEAQLMRQHIYVDYFDDILVYEERFRRAEEFNRQHFRWFRSQAMAFFSNIRYMPQAILSRHYDMIDKLLQWMLMPRMVMMCIIIFMGVLLPFIYFSLAIKWWILFAVVLFIFALATPNYLIDDKWDRTFFMTPLVLLSSLLSHTAIGAKLKNLANKKL